MKKLFNHRTIKHLFQMPVGNQRKQNSGTEHFREQLSGDDKNEKQK